MRVFHSFKCIVSIRSFFTGIVSESMVRGKLFFFFKLTSFCFSGGLDIYNEQSPTPPSVPIGYRCKFPSLSVGFASDDMRRGKQLSVCPLHSAYDQLIGAVMFGLGWLTLAGHFEAYKRIRTCAYAM